MRGKSSKNNDAHRAPSAKAGSNSSHTHSPMLTATHFLQTGWRVAFALLIPAGLGIWADSFTEDSKTFSIIGVITGVILANIVANKYVAETFKGGSN